MGGEEEEVEFTQSLGGCGGRLSPLLWGRGSDPITILNETETVRAQQKREAGEEAATAQVARIGWERRSGRGVLEVSWQGLLLDWSGTTRWMKWWIVF